MAVITDERPAIGAKPTKKHPAVKTGCNRETLVATTAPHAPDDLAPSTGHQSDPDQSQHNERAGRGLRNRINDNVIHQPE